jgi:hypothetical protein
MSKCKIQQTCTQNPRKYTKQLQVIAGVQLRLNFVDFLERLKFKLHLRRPKFTNFKQNPTLSNSKKHLPFGPLSPGAQFRRPHSTRFLHFSPLPEDEFQPRSEEGMQYDVDLLSRRSSYSSPPQQAVKFDLKCW